MTEFLVHRGKRKHFLLRPNLRLYCTAFQIRFYYDIFEDSQDFQYMIDRFYEIMRSHKHATSWLSLECDSSYGPGRVSIKKELSLLVVSRSFHTQFRIEE